MLLLGAACVPKNADRPQREGWKPTIEVIQINDYLLAFYDGRSREGEPMFAESDENWVQIDMDLGTSAYVLYRGDRALVFDTLIQPEQGQFIRDYLEKKLGIRHIIVVNSHWHLDHLAGNIAFKDCDIISSRLSREILVENRADIEKGELWGPPSLKPLILPNLTFEGSMTYYLGDLELQLIPMNIHTPDSIVLYIPKDRILLPGDMLEDTAPYVNHPGELHEYLPELVKMRGMDIAAIYPDHGSPDKLKSGGYGKDFIDANIYYIRTILTRLQDKDFQEMDFQEVMAEWLEKGAVIFHEPYDDLHKANMESLGEYYQDKPLPQI
jgi:glyoxylase-like metal-dependent hydrolase (beta-lactamase superfamily II)